MFFRTKREIGDIGEKFAEKQLKKEGFRILERNIHLSSKEIDIIAENESYIIFVEVKTRSVGRCNYSRPAAAVDKRKCENLLSGANMYIRSRLNAEQSAKQPRIDVFEVYLDENGKTLDFLHIENAVMSRR